MVTSGGFCWEYMQILTYRESVILSKWRCNCVMLFTTVMWCSELHWSKVHGEGVNQAYSCLSNTYGHITDCKLDSVVYTVVCVVICELYGKVSELGTVQLPTFSLGCVSGSFNSCNLSMWNLCLQLPLSVESADSSKKDPSETNNQLSQNRSTC